MSSTANRAIKNTRFLYAKMSITMSLPILYYLLSTFYAIKNYLYFQSIFEQLMPLF